LQEVHDQRWPPSLPTEDPSHSGSQPLEIYVDDETKLTLHGLQQHYIKLEESAKNRKLNDLLDTLEFNQVSLLPTTLLSPFTRPRRSSFSSDRSPGRPSWIAY
jgi:hypothetical protein